MSDSMDKGKGKGKGKDAKAGKDKKGKNKKGAPSGGPSVAGHPRAAATVRRCKGAGGLVGFALAALLAHRAGLSMTQVAERALAAGIAGYLIAWTCAVTVCRQLVLAELRTAAERFAEHGPAMIPLVPGTSTAPATPAAPSAPVGAPATTAPGS